ncbi:hypothetical protein LguiA_029708 [Lonicera macranthoides]
MRVILSRYWFLLQLRKFIKHCRSYEKCVDRFGHHCRWLNNCVGRKNYLPFVCLMAVSLVWAMKNHITDRLRDGFTWATFATIVVYHPFPLLTYTVFPFYVLRN